MGITRLGCWFDEGGGGSEDGPLILGAGVTVPVSVLPWLLGDGGIGVTDAADRNDEFDGRFPRLARPVGGFMAASLALVLAAKVAEPAA